LSNVYLANNKTTKYRTSHFLPIHKNW
jgi:hypothetical protein